MGSIPASYERPAVVLLVEDNMADVGLLRESFTEAHIPVALEHVWNGRECLDYVYKLGSYAESPTPDLILLDLNMPVMSGHEVVEALTHDERTSHLPVVVMTSSSSDSDVMRMYRLRVNSYIVKPLEYAELLATVKDLSHYWFDVVELPEAG